MIDNNINHGKLYIMHQMPDDAGGPPPGEGGGGEHPAGFLPAFGLPVQLVAERRLHHGPEDLH